MNSPAHPWLYNERSFTQYKWVYAETKLRFSIIMNKNDSFALHELMYLTDLLYLHPNLSIGGLLETFSAYAPGVSCPPTHYWPQWHLTLTRHHRPSTTYLKIADHLPPILKTIHHRPTMAVKTPTTIHDQSATSDNLPPTRLWYLSHQPPHGKHALFCARFFGHYDFMVQRVCAWMAQVLICNRVLILRYHRSRGRWNRLLASLFWSLNNDGMFN